MKKPWVAIAAVFAVFSLVACMSPWKGDEGVVTLHFGVSGARAIYRANEKNDDNGNYVYEGEDDEEFNLTEDDVIKYLTHYIQFSNASGTHNFKTTRGARSAQFSVPPGRYDITIEACFTVADAEEMFANVGGSSSGGSGWSEPDLPNVGWPVDWPEGVPYPDDWPYVDWPQGSPEYEEEPSIQDDLEEMFEKTADGRYIIARGTGSVTVVAGRNNTASVLMDWLIPTDTDDGSKTEGWYSWADSSSSAKITHSVDDTGLCTITVSGTAITSGEIWFEIWKTTAAYQYYAEADENYTFKFEAWTQGAPRKMNVQWYGDEATKIYHNTGYGFYENGTPYPYFEIDSTPRIYTITTQAIPKSGTQSLSFQCANQTGTFYVRMMPIETYDINVNNNENWASWAHETSTASITYSVNNDGVCTVIVGGEGMPYLDENEWYSAYKANVRYNYPARQGARYTYEFEAWTEPGSGGRTLYLQYFNNWWDNSTVTRQLEPVYIYEDPRTFAITTYEVIPLDPIYGFCELEFQCGDQVGKFYVRIISIREYYGSDEDNVFVTIYMENNEDEIILNDSTDITISKDLSKNNGSFNVSIIPNGYDDNVQWLVAGKTIVSDYTLTILADDYAVGTYQLTVIVYKNNRPYSNDIYFTVTED